MNKMTGKQRTQTSSSVEYRTKSSALNRYFLELRDIRSSDKATEHSYRPALQDLVYALGNLNAKALNEPAQIDCGAPDFVVLKSNVPLGYIECKDIGFDLDKEQESEQIMRYRSALPNLILSNYLEFRWYQRGELRTQAKINAALSNKRSSIAPQDLQNLINLFELFFNESAETINQAIDLAKHLANKTRLLRESILEVLNKKPETSLHKLLSAYRAVLIPDLSPNDFADMQAQTISYGLFAARFQHKSSQFSRETAVFTKTTPFLQEVFQVIAGTNIHPMIEWIVEDLVYLLKKTDMKSVLKRFGDAEGKQDPVVHFYEDFLRAYNPELKRVRGAYYTPLPIVSYIVRSVDHLLQEHFDVKNGLANSEASENVLEGSENKEVPRVVILDPATGTGTFLCEVVREIKSKIESQGLAGAWPDYVRNHLLPRLYGFELMMGPYAICHLNLALEISGKNSSYTDENRILGQLNVLLTNTLEKSEKDNEELILFQIANEAASSNSVKSDQPVMVIVGNPPWNVNAKNNRRWIDNLLRGVDGQEKTGSYFKEDGVALTERNIKLLNDDYVKFMRFSQWRIEKTGEGIVGFVISNSWLDNLTFRGMRDCLLSSFDEIYVLNLHGSAKTPVAQNDENVFDIQQGVAIVLMTKFKGSSNNRAKLYYTEITGKKSEKYKFLNANDVDSTEWTELYPSKPLHLFVTHDQTHQKEYENGWGLDEIFLNYNTGIKSSKDKIVYHDSKEKLIDFVSEFVSSSPEDARIQYELGDDKKDGWNVYVAHKELKSELNLSDYAAPVLYRPFDIRFTCYTGKIGFIARPRYDVMKHMKSGNLGLISCRQQSQLHLPWNLIGISKYMIDICALSAKTKESTYLFPLFIYEKDILSDNMLRIANLNEDFIRDLERRVNMRFIQNDEPFDSEKTFCPEDVLHYIYALLYSEKYREKYKNQLRYSFPAIQLPANPKVFTSLANLGKRLVKLHLMEGEVDDEKKPTFPVIGDGLVTKVNYVPNSSTGRSFGQVWINENQYFDRVELRIWKYRWGSFSPAESWLKYKKNKRLDFNDIQNYRDICGAIDTTLDLTQEIDKVVDW